MALVVLSKVELWLDAVRAVSAGATVTEVAAAVGVECECVVAAVSHRGRDRLADRSHRPRSCPHQCSDAVMARVAGIRRTHTDPVRVASCLLLVDPCPGRFCGVGCQCADDRGSDGWIQCGDLTLDRFGDRIKVKVADVKSKAEDALKRGSVWVAIAAGVILGAPTPFSLAAIGMVRNGNALPTQLLLILCFSLITYLVAEIPIISYVARPEGTAARVETFATWLGTHKIQAVAALAAVVGVVFIGKGLTSL